MKKKIIIGAGILLTIFVAFLVAICGGASGNKIVTKEELKTKITNIECHIDDEENIIYSLDELTNDISFDSNIKSKNYTELIVNKENGFNTFGVSFAMKSDENFTLNISLNKNGISLVKTEVIFEEGQIEYVNLTLEECVKINTTDKFTILFSQENDCEFMFDTFLFFFDEVK